jgi:hypothetical protein
MLPNCRGQLTDVNIKRYDSLIYIYVVQCFIRGGVVWLRTFPSVTQQRPVKYRDRMSYRRLWTTKVKDVGKSGHHPVIRLDEWRKITDNLNEDSRSLPSHEIPTRFSWSNLLMETDIPVGTLNLHTQLDMRQADNVLTEICVYWQTVEVCTGPGLGAQTIFGSKPGSVLVQMPAVKRHIEHFGLSRAIIFSAKKKLFVVGFILCSWHSRAPETNPTDLIFSGNFVGAPSQK